MEFVVNNKYRRLERWFDFSSFEFRPIVSLEPRVGFHLSRAIQPKSISRFSLYELEKRKEETT